MKLFLYLIALALVILPREGVMADDMLHPVIIGAPGSVATDWLEDTWDDASVKVKELKRTTYKVYWRCEKC